jgi:hypothetical protein
MALSNYLVKKWLDRALGAQAFTDPATVYLALFTSAPSASGGGTEVSGGSYARKSVTNNNTNFPDSILGTGEKFLGVDTPFTAATGSWGVITHVGLFDASTAGNLLHFGALASPVTIGTGDIFRFPLGNGGLLLTLA